MRLCLLFVLAPSINPRTQATDINLSVCNKATPSLRGWANRPTVQLVFCSPLIQPAEAVLLWHSGGHYRGPVALLTPHTKALGLEWTRLLVLTLSDRVNPWRTSSHQRDRKWPFSVKALCPRFSSSFFLSFFLFCSFFDVSTCCYSSHFLLALLLLFSFVCLFFADFFITFLQVVFFLGCCFLFGCFVFVWLLCFCCCCFFFNC